jgi:hypothetical protein
VADVIRVVKDSIAWENPRQPGRPTAALNSIDYSDNPRRISYQ